MTYAVVVEVRDQGALGAFRPLHLVVEAAAQKRALVTSAVQSVLDEKKLEMQYITDVKPFDNHEKVI